MLSASCIVDCANTAVEAIEKAKTCHYDFVLMDFHMPDHDGLWLMHNWKLPRKTKIILMTGYLTQELLKQMLELGISSYMVKPLTREGILHVFDDLSKLPIAKALPNTS